MAVADADGIAFVLAVVVACVVTAGRTWITGLAVTDADGATLTVGATEMLGGGGGVVALVDVVGIGGSSPCRLRQAKAPIAPTIIVTPSTRPAMSAVRGDMLRGTSISSAIAARSAVDGFS